MSLVLVAVGIAVLGFLVAWLLSRTRGARRRRPAIRLVLLPIAVLVTATPLSLLVTLLLLPVWRWLESASGIESIGHSGPAEWCYLLTFLACLVPTSWVWIRALRGLSREKAT